MSRDFFCERCSLQFGKKYVFDLHLSLVHGEKKIEVKVESPLCDENLQESQISETEFSYQTVQKTKEVHMRYLVFISVPWMVSSESCKGCIRTNMHTTVYNLEKLVK